MKKDQSIQNKLPTVNVDEIWSNMHSGTLRQLPQLNSRKVVIVVHHDGHSGPPMAKTVDHLQDTEPLDEPRTWKRSRGATRGESGSSIIRHAHCNIQMVPSAQRFGKPQ